MGIMMVYQHYTKMELYVHSTNAAKVDVLLNKHYATVLVDITLPEMAQSPYPDLCISNRNRHYQSSWITKTI